jgi:hypothetical protein
MRQTGIERFIERERDKHCRLDVKTMKPGEMRMSATGTYYVRGQHGELRRADVRLSKKERKAMKKFAREERARARGAGQ